MIDSQFLSELANLGLTGTQYQGVLSAVSRLFATEETKLATRREKWRDQKRNVRKKSSGSPAEVQPDPSPKEKNQTPFPSVANATALIWQDCIPLLTSLGLAERHARSNLGRWLKAHPEQDVRRAVSAAIQAGTADPIPYITKTLKSFSRVVAPLEFRKEPPKISKEEWQKLRRA